MFILASKSPRRAELLKKIYNKEFIIDPTYADESKIKNIDPSDTSLAIALLKMNEAIKSIQMILFSQQIQLLFKTEPYMENLKQKQMQ